MQQYIFHKENKANWEGQRLAIATRLKVAIDTAKSDFVVRIEDYKESSPKALRGYWRLVGIVTDYINSTSPDYKWSKEEISDNIKEQVNHIVVVDLMPFWKVQYKNGTFTESKEDDNIYFCQPALFKEFIFLGKRYEVKPKSISKKSGCTYEEMSRLIEKVLQFGSEIPDCVLTTAEDMEFKKYYGVK